MTDIATAGSRTVDTAKIPGWGVDADPDNDPTYPYREREKDDGLRMDWDRPPPQRTDVEVLQSIEHKRRPAVVGTSTPPRWVSGAIRRQAFRWSESHLLHWMMLMGADRINVVEGIVQDLGRGKIPNIPAEMGARSEWAHNKRGFVTKAAILAGVTAGLVALSRRGSRSRQQEAEPPERNATEASGKPQIQVEVREASNSS
jgi:hypothetical protein